MHYLQLQCLALWLVVDMCQVLRGGGKLYRRFKQLMIPFILWSLIAFICWRKYDSGGELIDIFVSPDTYMWFLWALFWIFCLFEVCKWFSSRLNINEIIPIITVGLLLMVIMVVCNLRMFGLQFVSYYYYFYSIGYFYSKYAKLQIHNNLIIGLFLVWCILAFYWKMHELPYWIPSDTMVPSSIIQYLYRGITGTIGVFLLFAFFSTYLNGEGGLIKRFILNCGSIPLGLYVVYIILVEKMNEIISDSNPNLNAFLIVLFAFCIVLFLSYAIVTFINKFNMSRKFLLGKI